MARQIVATYLRTVGKTNEVDVSSDRKYHGFPFGTKAGAMSNYAKELSAADPDTNWVLWTCMEDEVVSI